MKRAGGAGKMTRVKASKPLASETMLIVAPAGAINEQLYEAANQEFPEIAITRMSRLREACDDLRPPVSLILIDASLLDGLGQYAIELQRFHPSAGVVALSESSRLPDSVLDAVAADTIQAVVPTDLPRDIWLGILNLLLKGLSYFPRSVIQAADFPRPGTLETTSNPLPALTGREINVLDLVARGMLSKEIAAELALSENTVKVHIRHILAKLDVATRTEAAAIFHKWRA
jgi:DNA-binding NarL/FixJ family response regulator